MENTPDTPPEGEPPVSEKAAPEPEIPGPGPSDEQPPAPPSPSASDRHTTDLRRPKDGRIVAGVAAGIADRLGVQRWIIRLAFVLLTAGGGSGVLLYIAAWLLIREEGQPESVGQRWANQANGTRPWVGVILVLVAAAVLFSNLPFFDGGLLFPTALLVIGILLYRGDLRGVDWKPRPATDPTADPVSPEGTYAMSSTYNGDTLTQSAPVLIKPRTPPSQLGQITVGLTAISLGLLAAIDRTATAISAEPRHYFALAVVVLGVGTLIGTFFGRARWLIPLGLLLVPPMIGTSVADAYDGEWRTPRLVRPAEFAALNPTYEQGAGELVIDLTDLPWAGESVTLGAELGVGELELRVPDGVAVEASGDVGIGEFATFTSHHGGFGVDRTFSYKGNGSGTVVATLEVGIGRIFVDTDDDRLFDGDGPIAPAIGDLVAEVSSPDALEDTYATVDGDITLDLTGLVLTSARAVEVTSGTGDITVILPESSSYRVVARTDTGVVDLFGEDSVDRGGTVRADSISAGAPVIALDIQSLDGDISLIEGERE